MHYCIRLGQRGRPIEPTDEPGRRERGAHRAQKMLVLGIVLAASIEAQDVQYKIFIGVPWVTRSWPR
jgi:hypothetical protein